MYPADLQREWLRGPRCVGSGRSGSVVTITADVQSHLTSRRQRAWSTTWAAPASPASWEVVTLSPPGRPGWRQALGTTCWRSCLLAQSARRFQQVLRVLRCETWWDTLPSAGLPAPNVSFTWSSNLVLKGNASSAKRRSFVLLPEKQLLAPSAFFVHFGWMS